MRPDDPPLGHFPLVRMRRRRQQPWVRRLCRENSLSTADLIWPVFLTEGKNHRVPIKAMPGIERLSVDLAVKAARYAHKVGIPALALFPHTKPSQRDEHGSEALNPDNLVCRATRAIKKSIPHIGIICDVALDPYTRHGHDGILSQGTVANDETLKILVKQALVQAEAGCDILAPSDMMDGRVGAIRRALEQAGYKNTLIMAYAAKYASALYDPFREAIGTAGLLKGDKRTYQMDPANRLEALRETALDLAEGADMVIVKPGLFYLDVLHHIKQTFQVPTFAYQVSGEYAMIATAPNNKDIMLESLLAFKRAGADGIVTYFAPEAARLLGKPPS